MFYYGNIPENFFQNFVRSFHKEENLPGNVIFKSYYTLSISESLSFGKLENHGHN